MSRGQRERAQSWTLCSDEPMPFKVRECHDAGEHGGREHLAAAHGRAQPLGRHPKYLVRVRARVRVRVRIRVGVRVRVRVRVSLVIVDADP